MTNIMFEHDSYADVLYNRILGSLRLADLRLLNLRVNIKSYTIHARICALHTLDRIKRDTLSPTHKLSLIVVAKNHS